MDDYLTKPIKLPDLSSVIRGTFLEGSPSPRSSA
jgi:CheY-like chemotaxis protein